MRCKLYAYVLRINNEPVPILPLLLATAEQEVGGKWHTGENIINEEGLSKKYVGKNIIYLLENKVSVIPSNFREKIYEKFSNENMTEAFIKVVKELNAFGLI